MNAVRSLALAGNFKFRVAGLFLLPRSRALPFVVVTLGFGEFAWGRSGAERIGATISSVCSCFLPCRNQHGMFCICGIIMLPGFGFTSLCSIDELCHSRKHNLPSSLFDSLVRLYAPAFRCIFVCFFRFVSFGCADNGG